MVFGSRSWGCTDHRHTLQLAKLELRREHLQKCVELLSRGLEAVDSHFTLEPIIPHDETPRGKESRLAANAAYAEALEFERALKEEREESKKWLH